MALVSTPVSYRKAFVRVDSAASKDNSLKEVGIFSINLNSEAVSSQGLETRSNEENHCHNHLRKVTLPFGS